MHRIFQSRKRLTKSIASATKAEEELEQAMGMGMQTEKNDRDLRQPGALSNPSSLRPPSSQRSESDQGNSKKQKIGDHQNQTVCTERTHTTGTVEATTNQNPDNDGDAKPSCSQTSIHEGTSEERIVENLPPTAPAADASFSSPSRTKLPPLEEPVMSGAPSVTPSQHSNIDSNKLSSPSLPANDLQRKKPATETLAKASSEPTSPGQPQKEDSASATIIEIDLTTPERALEHSTSVDLTHRENHNEEDPEVCIVIPPQAYERPPDESEKGASGPHTEHDYEDDDVQVVSSTTVNPNIVYPHKRIDCGLFDFAKNPKRFCEKCYCVACDIPAKDCPEWDAHSVRTRRVPSTDPEMSHEEEEDEILLESPTTTRRNYLNELQRQRPEEPSEADDPSLSINLSDYESGRMRITEVLDYKVQHFLRLKQQKYHSQRLFLEFNEGSRNNHTKDGNNPSTFKNSMEGDISQLGLHSSFFVEGIKIGWPFPTILMPQRQMAIHIIKALKRKLHVVLESPTGTGKSVAILCSVLAWQRYHAQTNAHKNNDPLYLPGMNTDDFSQDYPGAPKIIYCCRTHSQVTQMVSSLKKTPYRPKMTVMGSRDRMCIHKGIKGVDPRKQKISVNLACKIRRRNTEAERKRKRKDHAFDDNHPLPQAGDGLWDEDNSNDDTGDASRKPPPTCPHYRQLTSNKTSETVVRQFLGGAEAVRQHQDEEQRAGCCGSQEDALGGEESAFGVHDLEDLVRFAKNPHKETNIAVYRGRNGKFGFSIKDNKGANAMGCFVASLTSGGSAAFEGRLRIGDRILKVNGVDVRTFELSRTVALLSQTPIDQPARLDVLRAGADTTSLLDPNLDAVNVPGENEESSEEVYSEESMCPYYVSRTIQKHAEITFSPYNYVLDPSIRRVMDIQLKNTVLVLDEAHNIESILSDGGSCKFGEIDLFQIVANLGRYARRTEKTSSMQLIEQHIEVDSAEVAHDLLLFVEKLIFHMRELKEKFELGPGQVKLEEDYRKYHALSDNHEVELSYDGPTGYGIKGKAVGCQPFLTRLDITKDECTRLHGYALSMEVFLLGGNSEGENERDEANANSLDNNMLSGLVELLSKLVTATRNPEHFYISCVVKANGNLDHAFGIEESDDNFRPGRRFKKKPRTVPFMSPRTEKHPNAYIPICNVGACKTHSVFGSQDGVRHGDYCNGTTPPWECHLVIRLLSPGLLMREIAKDCHSVILASGSLSPLPSLCAELSLFGKDSSSTPSPTYPFRSALPSSGDIGSNVKPPSSLKSITTSTTKNVTDQMVTAFHDNRLQTTPKPLEANHVINLSKQLLAVAIGHFPNGEKLTVSYSSYKHDSFLPKLGHAISAVIEGVPSGGCLVFFPSYSLLNKCVSCWDAGNEYNRFRQTAPEVWGRLLRSKGKIIVEPTGNQEEFEKARDCYMETIRKTGNCILFAVFRGKMSEGISFNDNHARAVLCIGMPYPNYAERSVKAKQNYNDEQRKLCHKTCLLPGGEYYSQQAYRAIAQALGRCIRHGADYGTIILMDSRHCDDGSPNSGICRAHKNLPKWMRGSVRTLSMNSKQGYGKQPILNGYAGLRQEMRSFFVSAPTAAQSVRSKWNMEKAQRRSAAKGSRMKFHKDTGNWTTEIDRNIRRERDSL